MNANLNRRELTFKALAGLAGGALGWLPVELATHNHTLTEQVSSAEAWASTLAMCILSGLIGGFIIAAGGQQLELNRDTQLRFARGFGICAVLAYFGNGYSNALFSEILYAGGWGLNQQGSIGFLVLARVASWTLMGLILGAGVGIATLNLPNILKGGAGGVVGGLIGGLTFDLINMVTGGGLLSRLVGLSAIGLAIGLFIGLVQELTKAAWVTVEQGRLRGRQYRVEGARATIGRAEENPVGLFGDPGVQARHAVIERRGAGYVIRNLAIQDGTFVNGNRIETADLRDGDRIRIGGYEMIFHLRGSATPAAAPHASPALEPVAAVHIDGPCLVDAAGNRYPLPTAAVTRMGRALDNEIVINHASVSRHHARVEARSGAFDLTDLGSQNGTFIDNQRVTTAQLNDGATLRLGDAPFTFRA